MADYMLERLAEADRSEREKFEKLVNCHWLVGFYGARAERLGNAELAEMVAALKAVLDGTWEAPE